MKVEKNDVLLNITGDSVARCCIPPDGVLPARINQHVEIIRTDNEVLLPHFLMYYLASPLMQSKMLSLAGSGGTRKALTKSMIVDFDVPVPPLSEQKRVLGILSAFDDLIKVNRERIEQLEKAARMLFREWFVHYRFPGHQHSEFSDGVPKNWDCVSATDIIDVKPKMPTLNGQEVWYVPMAALSEQGVTIDLSEARKREKQTSVRFQNGDVLFAGITPCLENGKTALVQFLDDDEIATGSTEFIVLRGSHVSSAFTYCLARTYDFRQNAIKSMTGSSGRQRVQTECFDRFTMGLPPEHLRDEFDNIAGSCFEQIHLLQQQNQELKRARDTLLPRLMSGEITV